MFNFKLKDNASDWLTITWKIIHVVDL
jgi:hypothetical protein